MVKKTDIGLQSFGSLRSPAKNTGEIFANFQSSGNFRLLRERLNKSVNCLFITGAASLRTLFQIWSKSVTLATSNFDSNFKFLDGLISANKPRSSSVLIDDVGRFVARFGPIWVKWPFKWFAISSALFKVLLDDVKISLTSVTPDFLPIKSLSTFLVVFEPPTLSFSLWRQYFDFAHLME